MRVFEANEIWEWCAERGVALADGETRPAPDPELAHAARVLYANGGRSGRDGRATDPRLRVSHDEWAELQARAPVEFHAPAV